ncbi:MAG TPA: DUF58 domain-containing protein [Gammaproteobacteria bacterium]|nr:DUF58 domain-containing protein [Gammaproteobacteria bacterium]
MMFGKLFSRQTAAATAAAADGTDTVRVSRESLLQLRHAARDLPLVSRKAATSVISGAHVSRFRGRGMDYLESRGYQPGDDIRSMDWRVTARSGRAHIKVYQEERERPIVVMLDLGPGMFFATRGAFKSVIAARAAALIGWAAVQHGDRIGALLFNGGHHELRPLGGSRGALRLIRTLVEMTDPERTPGSRGDNANGQHLNDALMRLRRVARPGSLVFLLGDFYGCNPDTRRHLQSLRKHNDVIALQIVDPVELVPPPPGHYAISDGRRNGLLDTRSPARRQAYLDYFTAHHRSVRELMQQCAIPLQQLTTTDPVTRSLRLALANAGSATPLPEEAVA